VLRVFFEVGLTGFDCFGCLPIRLYIRIAWLQLPVGLLVVWLKQVGLLLKLKIDYLVG